jgi:hypothetical protein
MFCDYAGTSQAQRKTDWAMQGLKNSVQAFPSPVLKDLRTPHED